MAVRVEVSQVIDRPPAEVFRFYAVEHVQNHPRWDPDMQLELLGEGPLRVGSMIKRVNSRSGQPVEGTMEVTEFAPNKAMSMIILDGQLEMRGRATFEPEGEHGTRLSFDVEIPGVEEGTDTSPLADGMRRSLANIKRMVESGA